MPPSKKSDKSRLSSKKPAADPLPKPFTPVPDALHTHFTPHLDERHVYIAHIDTKPSTFKRKIFLVPVAMNMAVALLFFWRMASILPYYYLLLRSVLLSETNETTFDVASATWGAMAWEIARRTSTFMLDLLLFIFVWPWPVEFCAARANGNPVRWRLRVGFREKEIYVRRSRAWDVDLDGYLTVRDKKETFLSVLREATSPMLLSQKTGYLLMDAKWDLDWRVMVAATTLADAKAVPLESFGCIVLVHDKTHGWMCLDMSTRRDDPSEERRRQVFAFRDALQKLGKEDLFYRWIEIVQYESTRPGGFGEEKQVEVAQKIREMFNAEGINFDELWMESVGSEGIAGM
ncbi:hypothetical protein VUR80DRAFT_3401 [Thermomyces stellatus]